MRILALTGRCAAGKGTTATIIKSCWPAVQIITTGDILRKMVSKSGLPLTHANMQEFNQGLLREKGDDYISFIFDFFEASAPFVLIDCIRRPVDISAIEKSFGKVTILGIFAEATVRLNRIRLRNRAGDASSSDAFAELTGLEDAWGVDRVSEKSAVSFQNMGTIQELTLDVQGKLTPLMR
jgi:dephospho-CoA kinase